MTSLPTNLVFTCPNSLNGISNNSKSSEQERNSNTLTKAQQYASAARNTLTTNGKTQYATQNKFGTNPNAYDLLKIPNSNVLLIPITKPCND